MGATARPMKPNTTITFDGIAWNDALTCGDVRLQATFGPNAGWNPAQPPRAKHFLQKFLKILSKMAKREIDEASFTAILKARYENGGHL